MKIELEDLPYKLAIPAIKNWEEVENFGAEKLHKYMNIWSFENEFDVFIEHPPEIDIIFINQPCIFNSSFDLPDMDILIFKFSDLEIKFEINPNDSYSIISIKKINNTYCK